MQRIEYIKEIAQKINNAKCYTLDNPTIDDIVKLQDYDYIITDGKYSSIMIRRRFLLKEVLGIPTVFWTDGYELGDNILGMIPFTFNAEEILQELNCYKGQ